MEDEPTQVHRTNHGIKFVFERRMVLPGVSRNVDRVYSQLERRLHVLRQASCSRARVLDADVPFLGL
jgi:hypothetical protein